MSFNLQILNEAVSTNEEKDQYSDGDISARLQKLMLKIKGDFMTEKGRAVDYSALRSSDMFARYTKECTMLHGVDLGSLGDEEKIAFFISIILWGNEIKKVREWRESG